MSPVYWLSSSGLVASVVAFIGPWQLAVACLVFGFFAMIAQHRITKRRRARPDVPEG